MAPATTATRATSPFLTIRSLAAAPVARAAAPARHSAAQARCAATRRCRSISGRVRRCCISSPRPPRPSCSAPAASPPPSRIRTPLPAFPTSDSVSSSSRRSPKDGSSKAASGSARHRRLPSKRHNRAAAAGAARPAGLEGRSGETPVDRSHCALCCSCCCSLSAAGRACSPASPRRTWRSYSPT